MQRLLGRACSSQKGKKCTFQFACLLNALLSERAGDPALLITRALRDSLGWYRYGPCDACSPTVSACAFPLSTSSAGFYAPEQGLRLCLHLPSIQERLQGPGRLHRSTLTREHTKTFRCLVSRAWGFVGFICLGSL